MPPLSEQEARDLAARVLALSKAEHCELTMSRSDEGNIRTARNAVSTSGAEHNASLVVRAHIGKRVGSASTNAFDDASLARVVARAEELARLAPEDPEYMPPLGPQPYRATPAFVERTAAITPEDRAAFAGASLEVARQAGCASAAFLEHSASWQAIANSEGLFGYHRGTRASFTVTARTEDSLGSGFGTQDSNDFSELDAAAATRIATQKAVASRETRAIEPGKYTVILEPAASVDLLQQMVLQMDARNADEGRSYLAKRGGGTRLGEKLVDERVTITSDPWDPRAAAAPWSGGFGGRGGGGGFGGGGGADGRPQQRTVFIENGVVKQLAYSRYWAQKKGVPAVPGPANLLMSGGTASLEELIKGTARGVLVTRTWYIRPVDPQTVLYTGLTRDGTFYIEDGQIRYAIKNMRFNESPVIMLNNLDELGKPVRVRNAETALVSVLPPMRVRDFTFSSLSDAV